MKKLLALLVIGSLICFTSCSDDDDPKKVLPEEITLNETEAELEAGKTLQLKATIKPADVTDATLTWTSSNPAVATVDAKGLVTAIKEGTVNITVKGVNSAQAVCLIKVKKAPFKVPAEMVGKLTGVKIALTNGEDVYDESIIRSILKNDDGTPFTKEEQDQWINEVRTQFSYEIFDDNAIIMKVALAGGGTKDTEGIISQESNGGYMATMDIEGANINMGQDGYDKQEVGLEEDGTVTIKTPFGKLILITYYKVTK